MREVRAATLLGYKEVAAVVGLDPFEMFAETGISPQFLDDTENRYAAAPIVKLLEESAEKSRCESFGLLMADCRSFPSLGPLSLLLEHLPTVGDVVDALIDYRRVINDIVALERRRGPNSEILELSIASGYAKPQIIDLTVAVGYRVLAGVSGNRWQPDCVHVTHRAPADVTPFRRFFSAPVEFESTFNGFSCSPESLHLPAVASEATMAKNARCLLDLVPLVSEHSPISDGVRRMMALLLPRGKASLANVASALGMTARTLQRRLAYEGEAFSDLLSEVRKEVSQFYLSHSTQPIERVAELAGYSSSSAFTRWFASEFGEMPSAWRQSKRRGR